MPTRPSQGGSNGTWGTELNAWLDVSLNTDGTLKSSQVQTALGGVVPFKYDPRLTWLGQSIKRILVGANESFGIAILSDSTGDGISPADWPAVVAGQIAAAYPAWTIRETVYSPTTETYPLPTTIQTGTAGARSVRFVAASNQSLQIPNGDVGTYTDLDIAVQVNLDDWSPVTIMTLAAHFGAAGQRSWEFIVKASGTLALSYSTDGTTIITDTSTVVTGVADGTTKWVRCQYQGSDGAGNRKVLFYTSTDGVTWTQLGTTVTTVGNQTLFNASATPYEIGGRQGATQVITGNIFEVRLLSALTGSPTTATGVNALNSAIVNVGSTLGYPTTGTFYLSNVAVTYTGITGTSFTGCGAHAATVGGEVVSPAGPVPVAPCFPEQWSAFTAGVSPTAATGAPILHLSFGAISGQGLSYLTDANRLKRLLPDYSHRAVILSTSHNDTNQIGSAWLATWKSWITSVQALVPNATLVIGTENPRFAPASWIREHTIRREKLLALASLLSLPVIDAYQAFLDQGAGASSYVQADGIHPTVTGSATDGAHLWGNYVYAGLFPS